MPSPPPPGQGSAPPGVPGYPPSPAPPPSWSAPVPHMVGQQVVDAASGKMVGSGIDWVLKMLLPAVVVSAAVGGATGAVIGQRAGKEAGERVARAAALMPKGGGGSGGGGGGDAQAATPRPLDDLGVLAVRSTPPEAQVTLDGRLVGRTPIERLDVAAGRHAVVLEKAGHLPHVGEVAVETGKLAALEVTLEAASADAATGRPARSRPVRPAGPRRDCDGERSNCKRRCDDAAFSCRSSCQYCGTCVTSMTWDECNRICNTCRQGCEQNEKFCASGCEGSYDSCRASSP